MTKPNVGERENKPLTPAGANPLSESLGAGYQGRTEELLDFPEHTLRFLGTAAQQKRDREVG